MLQGYTLVAGLPFNGKAAMMAKVAKAAKAAKAAKTAISQVIVQSPF
jgi:hypothetical protein